MGIGLTSVFIAGKLSEVLSFSLKTVVKQMGHGKIEKRRIIKIEEDILKSLDYELFQHVTLIEYINEVMCLIGIDKQDWFHKCDKVLHFLGSLVMMDYNSMVRFPFKYLACALIYLTMKIIQKKGHLIEIKKWVKILIKDRNLKEKHFLQVSKHVLELVQVST